MKGLGRVSCHRASYLAGARRPVAVRRCATAPGGDLLVVTAGCAKRAFLSATLVRRLEMNPAKPAYSIEHAFEEPSFRFLCDGYDVDLKNEIREIILKAAPRPLDNFTVRPPLNTAEPPLSHEAILQLLRVILGKRVVSFAEIQSTPRHLYSFFETIASYSVPMAMIAADHFTFAGLVATHGSNAYRQAILDGADTMNVLGTIACDELLADATPLNTEARYDKIEKCFILRGAGKFNVVAAEHADWAIVTATLTTSKQDNHGTHGFIVPLRLNGALAPGVSVRGVGGESVAMSGMGVGIVHFESIRLPREALLRPYSITEDGKVEQVAMPVPWEGMTAMQILKLRRRIATGSLYLGALKALLTNIVTHVAQREVVGPDGRRTHPMLGLQHVQTPLVCLLSKVFVYLAAWQELLPKLADPAKRSGPPSFDSDIQLAGLVHFLQESLIDLHDFSTRFLGVHSILNSTGASSALAIVELRREGVDTSSLIREVAHKSVTRNIGTTHWGWWLTGALQRLGSLGRFLRNPFYTPRIADLGRHLMFFSHKHYAAKKRLRESLEVQRRSGGKEHQWYDWWMFRHRQVIHCGEALMEMHFLDTMMAETQKCTDPRGRKILRDMGWIYALSRQVDRLDYLLAQQMLSPSKAVILEAHLDNIVTVLAPQCVHLVNAMQVPAAFRAPCASSDIESYWTIPGTNTGIQRGDKLVLHEDLSGKRFGDTKAEQETIEEEVEDFDLLHGLDEKRTHSGRSDA